jgi:hypothetical protein
MFKTRYTKQAKEVAWHAIKWFIVWIEFHTILNKSGNQQTLIKLKKKLNAAHNPILTDGIELIVLLLS